MSTNNTYPQPQALLQGYDSFLGCVRSSPLTTTQAAPINANASSYNRITVCTDTAAVINALSISAALSAGFLDTEISARASWAESLSMTGNSVAVVVQTVVVTGSTQYTDYTISKTSPTIQDFFNDYGDSFVEQIVQGGEYYAAFVFQAANQQAQQELEANLNVSLGSTLAAGTSFADAISSAATNTYLHIDQQMNGVSNPAFPDADASAIVQFALNFGSTNIDAPCILSFQVTGYEHASGTPADFTNVVKNRNALGVSSSFPFLENSAMLSAMTERVKNIKQFYAAYGYVDSAINEMATEISNDVTTLSDRINQIESDVANYRGTLSLPSLQKGMPLLNYTLAPIQDQTTSNRVAAGVMLQSITYWTAGDTSAFPGGNVTYTWIVGIQTTFSDGSVAYSGYGMSGSPIPSSYVQIAKHGPLNIAEGDQILSYTTFYKNFEAGIKAAIGILAVTGKGQTLGTTPDKYDSKSTVVSPPCIVGVTFGFNTRQGVFSVTSPETVTFSPATWEQSQSQAHAQGTGQ